jgi:site-specific recombinase XerD
MSMPAMHIDQFFDYMRSVRRLNTAMKYRDGATRFLAFLARSGVRFDRMPNNILQLFAQNLVFEKLSPASVGVYVAAAKRFLQWSHARGDTTIQVNTHIDLPKVTQPLPNALTQDHIKAFLALASKKPEPRRSALLLLPYCGLRANEILSLPLNGIIRLTANLDKSNPAHRAEYICFNVVGKGGTPRTVPLLQDGTPLLLSYLAKYRKYAQRSPYVFVHMDGRRLSDRTLRADIAEIRSKLGVRSRFTAHTLRRTYLTTLQRAGLDLASITKIAGHKSFQTTLNHYLEVHPEDLVNATAKTGARLVERGPFADAVGKGANDILEFLRNRKEEE